MSMNPQLNSRVRLEVRDHIALLTFTRATAANTIDLPFARELLAAAFAIEANPNVRAIVMMGEGKNFCFGGDLRAMSGSGREARSYLSELTATLHAALAHLAKMDPPLIAAVHGTAAGAGLGLALTADLAIAARSAKFAPAYTAVGLTPDAGCTFLLPRLVGYRRAMEMFLTNRILSAEEALSWGLLNDVVEDSELEASAMALAAKLAGGALGSFGAVKRLMAESMPGFEAQLQRESRSIAARGESTEGREGIAAFLDKRVPRYLP